MKGAVANYKLIWQCLHFMLEVIKCKAWSRETSGSGAELTNFVFGVTYAWASSVQMAAHFLQASAHSRQDSWWAACLEHSVEQAWQTSAHKACRALPNREPLASNRAHKAQTSAQSRHNKIHSLWPDATQSVMQRSQVTTQAKQASIQLLEISTA